MVDFLGKQVGLSILLGRQLIVRVLDYLQLLAKHFGLTLKPIFLDLQCLKLFKISLLRLLSFDNLGLEGFLGELHLIVIFSDSVELVGQLVILRLEILNLDLHLGQKLLG